ncbi:hypothetical protein B0H19DRAFT_436414 [Mycena capillaripes]|nr:hypothetical protein B0H19DRAFT_436414 [Mycena capillaripes]
MRLVLGFITLSSVPLRRQVSSSSSERLPSAALACPGTVGSLRPRAPSLRLPDRFLCGQRWRALFVDVVDCHRGRTSVRDLGVDSPVDVRWACTWMPPQSAAPSPLSLHLHAFRPCASVEDTSSLICPACGASVPASAPESALSSHMYYLHYFHLLLRQLCALHMHAAGGFRCCECREYRVIGRGVQSSRRMGTPAYATRLVRRCWGRLYSATYAHFPDSGFRLGVPHLARGRFPRRR